MTILGIDVSHHQGVINWSQVKASGRDFCVLKATEGVGYTDPTLASNRKAAHAAGLIVGFYHFCRLGSPAAEAAYFAKVVGPLQPGEFVVLDYEPNPVPPGSAAWSKQWLDATRSLLGVAPLVYMNSYTMGVDNWSTVAKDYGLWLAKYDNSTAASPTQWWPTEAMKQHYDKGVVPGVAGPCDVDVFFGSRDQLLAYGYQGADMPLTDADVARIWGYVLDQKNGMGPAPAFTWVQDARLDVAQVKAWLRGGDPDHDNIALLWMALYGQTPPGNDNAMLKALADKITQAQTQTVDPVALANALLADDAVVAKLGKAIADNLQLSPRADS